ncbi:TonB-dependent receptor [Pedobacter heparinus]|uniref:TonB-dependent receptor n=1 Tax=Pedobacter heparinus TaxID=984 RepID=UPI002930CB9F|nr:TonB-dependent receptor [Pedobacter heparinus]
MKLIVVLIIASLLQASASGFAQKISLNRQNVPLIQIFRDIQNQTGYNFLYNPQMLERSNPVTIRISGSSLFETLDRVFENQPLTYSLYNDNIVIKERKGNEALKVTPQVRLLKGKVTTKNNVPLSGATVRVKETNQRAITDENGNFELRNVADDAVLIVSYISFVTVEIPLQGKDTLTIVLQEDNADLSEVVVVGYGTQKKVNLTGAIETIDGKVLESRPLSNVGSGLQGVIPNLNITHGPGKPGSSPAYNIRGATSINSAGTPLMIVDGVPADLAQINPNDVESVTVLKDASSAAIYGARAAFGVIIVTTKTGKKNAKPTISYSGLMSANALTYRPHQVNSLEFTRVYNEAADNANVGRSFNDDVIQGIKKYMEDPINNPYIQPLPTRPNEWFGEGSFANTNWYNEYYKSYGLNQNHNVSIAGGAEKILYYVSAGLYNQNGMLRYGNDRFNKYNITANISSEITTWLTMGARTRFNISSVNEPYSYGNYYNLVNTLWPNIPVRSPNGYLTEASRLALLDKGGRNENAYNDAWYTFFSEIKPVKGWKINFDYTFNPYWGKNTSVKKRVYTDYVDGSLKLIDNSFPTSVAESAVNDSYSTVNAYTSYEAHINRNNFKVLAGYQYELKKFYSISGNKADLYNDEVPTFDLAYGNANLSNAKSHWATLGYFGRLNYDFDNKYLLEFNLRYDGSSRFSDGRRWGLFPSVSAGYNISREKFWSPVSKYVNDFKLRASYGELGNQNVPNYLYLTLLNFSSNLPYILNNVRPTYLTPPGTSSLDVTWETIQTLDVGFDLSTFKNRLDVTFDWYRRQNFDMLGPSEAMPGVYGVAPPKRNNANMLTNGFEASVRWRDNIGQINYNVKATVGDWKAKITRYLNPTQSLSTYYEGMTLNELWGYETVGLFQSQEEIASSPKQDYLSKKAWTEGDVRYADLNGDGVIDEGNKTALSSGDKRVIGNSTPRYTFGLNIAADWKGFDFNMFWQGIGKRDAWLDGTRFWGIIGEQFSSNVYEETLDYWSPTNRNAYYPKPYLSPDAAKYRQIQTRYLQNAAYARLKNLQLGYSIPEKIAERFKFSKFRIFLNAENLFTITKMINTMDPETIGSGNQGNFYPLQRTYSFGINASL